MFSLTELPNNQEEVGKLLVKVRMIPALSILVVFIAE
jgi:hypothetical protein